MKRIINLLLLLFLAIVGSYLVTQHPVYSQTKPNIEQQVDFQRHFESLAVEGSIMIYDLNEDLFYQYNCDRNETPFLPASTYKIPNSLIALETGVIKNDVDVLTWDGIERGLADAPIDEWNQDLNMRLAFKYSAVWFYQVLARKIGHQRMQDFVTKIVYGNQNIGAEKDIDKFWLEGELRITPRQQIAFLRRLQQNDLPFAQKNIDLVKDIAIAEQTSNYILRVKTGIATSVTPQIGWYVGYLEQNDNVYFFATNIDVVTDKDLVARLEVTKLCLQDLGLL
ncbi:MAG: class D beta-lactamase [Waterburya sp.]